MSCCLEDEHRRAKAQALIDLRISQFETADGLLVAIPCLDQGILLRLAYLSSRISRFCVVAHYTPMNEATRVGAGCHPQQAITHLEPVLGLQTRREAVVVGTVDKEAWGSGTRPREATPTVRLKRLFHGEVVEAQATAAMEAEEAVLCGYLSAEICTWTVAFLLMGGMLVASVGEGVQVEVFCCMHRVRYTELAWSKHRAALEAGTLSPSVVTAVEAELLFGLMKMSFKVEARPVVEVSVGTSTNPSLFPKSVLP